MQAILVFCAGVAVSLAASWLLVSRLERLGVRAGFSEAWLGLVAALAADSPEITSSVAALVAPRSAWRWRPWYWYSSASAPDRRRDHSRSPDGDRRGACAQAG